MIALMFLIFVAVVCHITHDVRDWERPQTPAAAPSDADPHPGSAYEDVVRPESQTQADLSG